MILSFTAINKRVQFRDFYCQLADLEVAMDVLNAIVSQGDTLVKAYIIDEGSRIELPPEVFDGQPVSDSIHQLEKQWQAILSEPVHSSLPDTNWYIELTRQRIKIYEDRIDQLTLTINRFEQFRQRAEGAATHELRKTRLITYYESALSTYQLHIDRAKAGQQVAQKKLSQLQGCP